MKKLLCLLAVPTACVCLSAGLLWWMQKDKNNVPVELETIQGDPALLDGLCLEGDLCSLPDNEPGGGIWRQTVLFENGEAKVNSRFSPDVWQRNFRQSTLPSQLPLGISTTGQQQVWSALEPVDTGSHRLADYLPNAGVRYGCTYWTSGAGWMAANSIEFPGGWVLDIPVPNDSGLEVRQGEIQGEKYKTATYPWTVLRDVYAQGVQLSETEYLFTLPDAGLMDSYWELCKTEWSGWTGQGENAHWSRMASGGSEEQTPESRQPMDYTLHSGLFYLNTSQLREGSDGLTADAAALFSLDCTPSGSHILGMCGIDDSRAALLTIENGWYSVRMVGLPDGDVGEAVPLEQWNGEAVHEAQLEAQDGMLLARLNATRPGDEGRNWFLAIDCTARPSRKVWHTDTSSWDDGRMAESYMRYTLCWKDEKLAVSCLRSDEVSLALLDGSGAAYLGSLYSYSSMPSLHTADGSSGLFLSWDMETLRMYRK